MKTDFAISVRNLVDFVLMSGDIDQGGFSTVDRAREGQRVHTRIQRSRGDAYNQEVQVSRIVETRTIRLQINGRIDGVITEEELPVIEEIKTIRSGLQHYIENPDPLHWGRR